MPSTDGAITYVGLVVGILTADGRVDEPRMRQVRRASAPLQLTFHRAFDVINLHGGSVEEALQQVLDLGCDRLLTSGRAHKACSAAGMECLKKLTQYAQVAAPSFVVVAASGVSSMNCAQLIAETGVQGVHAGGSVTESMCVRDGGGDNRNDHNQSQGEGGVGDFNIRQIVNPMSVRELVAKSSQL